MIQQDIYERPWSKKYPSELKLQLDCGPCSAATYKESLSYKPTQAEETWGREGKKVTLVCEYLSKQVSVYQQYSRVEDEHNFLSASLKFSLVIVE